MINNVIKKIFALFSFTSFPGSREYWVQRYAQGGTSGFGSYGEYAKFKARTINKFVKEENISTVIEFGCGDGHQLSLGKYPSYIGFDVSQEAIKLCRNRFPDDESKSFKLIEDYENEKAELTLSLDVIFHLIEDNIFEDYMLRLFNSSSRFVIIYSPNTDNQSFFQLPHMRHRQFTNWIINNIVGWQLQEHIPNPLPPKGLLTNKTKSDFFIYRRIKK